MNLKALNNNDYYKLKNPTKDKLKSVRGISFIALVITIIVMIIISSVVILSINTNGAIKKAEEATFKSDMKIYMSEFSSKKIILLGEKKEIEDVKLKDANHDEKMREYISSLKDKHIKSLFIKDGKLYFMETDSEDQAKWAKEIGLEVLSIKAKINIKIIGNGTVNGKSSFDESIKLVGSTITLKAVSGSQAVGNESVPYYFDGWYANGKNISMDETYTGEIEGDTIYEARFVPEATLIYLTDGTVIKDTNTVLGSSTSYRGNTNIEKVECGQNCTTIKANTFAGCTNLKSINLNNVTIISSRALEGCSNLEEVYAPKVKKVEGEYAMRGTSGLKNVQLGSIGNPVESIAANAFNGTNAKSIIKIYIDTAKGTSLANSPFGATNSTIEYYDSVTGDIVNKILGLKYQGNTEIDWEDIPNRNLITEIRGCAFQGCKGLTHVELPDAVNVIGYRTFEGCTNLKSINLNNVTIISSRALEGCSNLEEVYAPKVKKVEGEYAMRGTSGLKNVQLGSIGNPVESIETNAFKETNAKSIIKIYIDTTKGTSLAGSPFGATYSTIEYYDSVTGDVVNKILGQKYKGNTEIDWKDIPNKEFITEIRACAFQGCKGLTHVELPDAVNVIGYRTFEGCTNLKSINLNNVTTIVDEGIRWCGSLEEVYAPKVKKIGSGAMSSTPGLKNVQLGSIGNPVESIETNAFKETNAKSIIKIYIDTTKGTSLAGSPFGATYSTIEYYDSVTGDVVNKILGQKYKGNTEIDWKDIPNKEFITEIRACAFQGCKGLTHVELPDAVNVIGYRTFEGCTNLKSINLNNVTTIVDEGIRWCGSLEEVYAPKVKQVGSRAMETTNGLKNVQLGSVGNPVESIETNAFKWTNAKSIIKIYIDTTKGTSLAGSPFGATYSTIEYYDSVTGESIN